MRLFFLILCALLPVLATAQQDDRGYLTRLIEDNLSGQNRTVTLTGFEGALSSEARIAALTIADADGVWLTLEDVVLQWSRAALLRGAIDVQQLRAARVVLARAPLPDDSAPAPEATAFALPELPVSITLDVLQIDRIELAPVFLGEAVALGLTGSAALAGGQGQVDLAATRLDGKQGQIALNGSYANATQVLALLLDLEEGPDGIAARLLDLPDRPSVRLQIAGDAPLSDFAARLALATDGQDRVAGDFALARDAAGAQQLSLDLGGDVAALVAPDYRDFFGDDARLRLAMTRAADGRIDIPDLSVTAARLQLAGAVRIGAQGWPETINLQGRIAGDRTAPVLLPLGGPRTFVDGVDLSLRYDAAVSDRWQIAARIAGLARPGVRIDDLALGGGGVLQSGAGAAVGRFTAALDYGATGLALDQDGAAEALGDTITGALALTRIEGQPTRITRLTLAGGGIDLAADAVIAGPQARFRTTANLAVQVAGLARFATLTGQDLGGAADLRLTADTTPLDGLFDLELQGTTRDLAIGLPQADALLAGRGQIAVRAVRDTQGTRITGLDLATPAATITGRATLTSAQAQADVTAALRDVALILPQLQGAATATGRLRRAADGQIGFDLTGTAPAARYSATGTVVPVPAQGRTINLDLRADVTDLTPYATLAGRPLAGAAAVSARGVVLSDGARFTLDLAGQTQDLVTGLAPLDPLLAGPGQIAARLARTGDRQLQIADLVLRTPAAAIAGRADLQADGPQAADLTLAITDAALIDPALAGPLDLAVTARPTQTGETAAEVVLTGPGTALRLDGTLAGAAQDHAIRGTLEGDIADLAVFAGLAGLPLRGSVSLRASGETLPDLRRFDAQAVLRSTDLAIGNPTADALLAGTGRIDADIGLAEGVLSLRTLEVSTPQVSVVGALNGNAGVGQGRFNASLRDIGLLTDQISGPVRATGSASLDAAGNWGVDATGTGPGGLAAAVRGSVAQTGLLDLAVTGSAPLALANTAIEPRRLSGNADFDLRARGAPGLEALSGQITFGNGRLAAPTLGQALSGITGAVRLAAGRAQIDLRANSEAGGSVAITGPVGLSAPNTADVTVALRDIVLQDPQLYRTAVSGAVTLQGPLQGGARIAGQLALGQTDLQVPSSGISALGDLPDVVHRAPAADVRRTLARAGLLPDGAAPAAGGGGGAAFPLDIVIDAPARIFIRGRGLDAELGGRLVLGGTSANILPVGRFDLLRGRIDILQQRFELTEGSAALQGDFVPFIRLVATTQSGSGTQISIVLEGPASQPEVTFQSVPELPQDEVLSQLIFGRDLQSISPFQAVQLASAISTLAGGGTGAVDRLRQNLGLDDFDVTTDADGNAALRAGRYLSDNIYTDVTVGSGGTEINLNLDITDEIVAKGGVDQEGDTSVGVFFERDY